MKLVLKRTKQTDKYTTGELHKAEDFFICYTLERGYIDDPLTPEIDTKPNESCIPAGIYNCWIGWNYINPKTKLPRPKIHILNVPHRSGIEIHCANWVHELKGCIAVGMEIFFLKNGTPELLQSRPAFLNKLIPLLQGIDNFELEIIDPI